MYVTRPLSRYRSDPRAAAEAPPEGPGSGFLVVVEETGENARTMCCGRCVDREMRGLPFPQNRKLALQENTSSDAHKFPDFSMLVPVVGEPLSSGRYYVVLAEGRGRGKVAACSKEGDKTTCCWCCPIINDVKPRPFDHVDVYQQVEVQRLSGDQGFEAVAVATDGIPPEYLRTKKGWKVSTMPSPKYDLSLDAKGVNSDLRSKMPDFDSLNIAERTSPAVVVGMWYVPFMFVKADGMFVKPDGCFVKSDGTHSLKYQARKCTFYQMTMEQSWEQIYSRDNPGTEVAVTATVRRSTAVLDGSTSVVPQEDGGAVWFRPATATVGLALDTVVWQRMRWELERGGWVAVAPDNDGNGDEERIERVERRDGQGPWNKFACYLLVERFLLKRADGSPALTCEFRHTDKIKAKWL